MRWARVTAVLMALGLLLSLASPAAADSHQLTVRVVPPLPGAKFSLDGRVFVANEQGVARISTGGPGTYMLEALPYRKNRDTVRAEFARWGDEMFSPRRRLEVPRTTDLEVGYELYHPISLRFLDPEGDPVDPDRIDGVLVKSSTGEEIEFEGTGPEWLKATRSLRRRLGLEGKQLLYSVQEVTIDGSNAVNQSEYRFTITGPAEWDLRLLLLSATFESKDAVFGMALGSHLVLEYPDGSVQRFPLENGSVRVDSLVRGSYLAHVDAPGYSPPMPVSLSREGQEAVLKVLSWFDVGLFFFLMTALAIGLLLLGRPHLARRVARVLRLSSRRREESGAEPDSKEEPASDGQLSHADAAASTDQAGRSRPSGALSMVVDALVLLLVRRPSRGGGRARPATRRPADIAQVYSLRSYAHDRGPTENGSGTPRSDEDEDLLRPL